MDLKIYEIRSSIMSRLKNDFIEKMISGNPYYQIACSFSLQTCIETIFKHAAFYESAKEKPENDGFLALRVYSYFYATDEIGCEYDRTVALAAAALEVLEMLQTDYYVKMLLYVFNMRQEVMNKVPRRFRIASTTEKALWEAAELIGTASKAYVLNMYKNRPFSSAMEL